MTQGRTTLNWWRAYIDGYDMSGYTRSFSDLACTFDEGIDDAVTLAVKSALTGSAVITMGTLNGLFDNTATSGLHVIMKGAGVKRNVMIAAGIQAEPAMGDPVFCGQFTQLGYYAAPDQNPVYASIPFGGMNNGLAVGMTSYAEPWGRILHAKSAVTGANSSAGLDGLAATAFGGYMMYHVFAAAGTGNMTATIKVQDSVDQTDGNFGDLLSSGVINCINGGMSGVVALAKTAAVKRYTRFQIALGTATSVTFALGFFRNWKI